LIYLGCLRIKAAVNYDELVLGRLLDVQRLLEVRIMFLEIRAFKTILDPHLLYRRAHYLLHTLIHPALMPSIKFIHYAAVLHSLRAVKELPASIWHTKGRPASILISYVMGYMQTLDISV